MNHRRHASLVFALFAIAVVSAQQTQELRVRVTLADAGQSPTPVQRHMLLVSDNPPSASPRAVSTDADGTAVLTLPPGSYIVESDHPVAFGGRAYIWTQVVQVVAGRDVDLTLSEDNAEIVPLESVPAPIPAGNSLEDPLLGKYQQSVVAVWSPTARASGFVVDSRGLIATDARGIGTATTVEVQLTPTEKVPASVLVSQASRDVAIIRIDSSVVADRPALSLACPPSKAPSLEDGQTIASVTVPHERNKEIVRGEITALHPRRHETDMRLRFGGLGGPVFNDAGAVVGLTSMATEPDSRPDEAAVVPTIFICEALAASLPMLEGAKPLDATRVPVVPTRRYPIDALENAKPGTTPNTAVPVMSAMDFDVAFITPPMLHRARQRAGWTGGQVDRPPEATAVLGRLTDLGAWSGYFDNLPAVLIVRVTPKMVEGFWKRVGREAARTQGADLPPFKDFKTSFGRMRATCGGLDVTPIHPFVLEHQVADKKIIREGLYVFDPGAFGPHCATVTFSFFSEAQPERADPLTLTRPVLDRIWNDFAPYRATLSTP
jgi:S1-C subfamily serine protease